MSYQDTQQVCLNGHQINDSYNGYPQYNKTFCNECGEKTIHECQNCKAPIIGHNSVDGVLTVAETPVPKHCNTCGKPYPWTEKESKVKNVAKGEIFDVSPLVEIICNKFHLVVRQIRQRHDGRSTLDVKDEYDVQDLLHALLKVFFEDIRDEEWTPSYAGSCSRVDFLLKKEKIVVEVKKTHEQLRDKKIGEELVIDINKYKSHPDCKTLICFVYDPEGYINKPRAIETDLTGVKDGLNVKTIIVPKGY